MGEEKVFDKKTVKRLRDLPGKARGINFTLDAEYLRNKVGEGAVRKVEEVLKGIGCELRYGEVKRLHFYPVEWRGFSLLAMKKEFGFGDEDFRKLGSYSAKASLVVRLYLKFFYSLPRLVEKGGQIWKEYLTEGELSVPEYSEEDKFARIKVEGFDLCPAFCRDLEGYFTTIIAMVVKASGMKCREKKCSFEGDKHHEFLASWK